MDKKITLVIASISAFIILTHIVQSQMGLGIWPAIIDGKVPFLNNYYTYVYLFNPTNKDADVAIKFECKNCSEKFDFFGINGQKILYLKYSIYPERMMVEKNTIANASKGFSFSVRNPLFFEHELIISNLKIPYWSLNIGKKTIDGEIQATLTNSMTPLTVTSKFRVTFEGIDPLILLLFVSIAIFSISLWVYYKQRMQK